MEENTRLPKEVVEEINLAAKNFAIGMWPDKENETHKRQRNYTEHIWEAAATAYATKLQEVQQENDSLTNQLKNHSNVSNENMKLLRQENEKLRVDRNEAKKLLAEVFRKHESGLLPDRFIYEKIKTFLYGE